MPKKNFEILDGILEGEKTKNTVRLIEIQSDAHTTAEELRRVCALLFTA